MYTPLEDPCETFRENHFPVMSLFSTPRFGSPKIPEQKCRPAGSRVGPWTQKPKRCAPENGELIQPEPGGASCGRKPI